MRIPRKITAGAVPVSLILSGVSSAHAQSSFSFSSTPPAPVSVATPPPPPVVETPTEAERAALEDALRVNYEQMGYEVTNEANAIAQEAATEALRGNGFTHLVEKYGGMFHSTSYPNNQVANVVKAASESDFTLPYHGSPIGVVVVGNLTYTYIVEYRLA